MSGHPDEDADEAADEDAGKAGAGGGGAAYAAVAKELGAKDGWLCGRATTCCWKKGWLNTELDGAGCGAAGCGACGRGGAAALVAAAAGGGAGVSYTMRWPAARAAAISGGSVKVDAPVFLLNQYGLPVERDTCVDHAA